MIDQETDSNLASPPMSKLTVPLEPKSADETVDDNIYSDYSPVIGKSDIMGEGWKALRQITDPQMADKFAKLLTKIQELLLQFQQQGSILPVCLN